MDSSEQDLPETDAESKGRGSPERTLPHTDEELREIIRDIIGDDHEAVRDTEEPEQDPAVSAGPVREIASLDGALSQSSEDFRRLVREIIADETSKAELQDLTPAETEVPQAAKHSRQPKPAERALPMSEEKLDAVVRDILLLHQTRALAGAAAALEWTPGGWRRWVTRTTGVLAGVLLALWLSLFVYAALSHRSETIPNDLLGMWTTSASTYADRYFEIGPSWLRFDTGASDVPVSSISTVDRNEEGSATFYRVEYLIGEDVYTFSFVYEQTPGAVIRFENQPLVAWRKGTS